MIFRNRFLSGLAGDDLEAIAPHLREAALSPGEILIEAGSRAGRLYFPSSAVVSEGVLLTDGRTVETESVGVEGVVGLAAAMMDAPQFTRAFTRIGGAAMAIDADVVMARAAVSRPLHALLMTGLVRLHIQSRLAVFCMAHHVLSQRLARWLLVTADRTGSPTFPMTQHDMATLTGTQRTSVHASAFDLKTRGLLHYSRGQVTLLDRPALEAEACACYRAVQAIDADVRGTPVPVLGV